jgi:nitrile hydratase
MNGVHDMGGTHGLGAIAPEADEPVFHEPWEARTLALTLAASAWRRWTLDTSRHQRELIAGPDYLRMSYYEKWFTGLERCWSRAAWSAPKSWLRAGPPRVRSRLRLR